MLCGWIWRVPFVGLERPGVLSEALCSSCHATLYEQWSPSWVSETDFPLAVGSHHLEYGLPSTHSTNCMSMALFLGAYIHDLHRAGSLSTISFASWVAFLVLYVLSVAGGRLYTGMHSFLDVSIGVALGTTGWVLQRLVMPEVEKWITHSGWSGASSFPFRA